MFALVALTLLAGVKEDLAEATRLLKSAQEEAAVQVLTRALDRGGLQGSQRSQLYLLLGIARVNLRDEEGAALAFTHGVEADANAKLPPKIAPPRARELFEAAKAEVARKAALPPVPEPKPEPAPEPPPAVVAMPAQPIYLHVPPGHARHWEKHCHEYNACYRPVYFVKSAEYAPDHGHGHHDG